MSFHNFSISIPHKKRPEHRLRAQKLKTQRIFFHPDYTVGIGISPIQRQSARGLSDCAVRHAHRRWGITPRPEDLCGWIKHSTATQPCQDRVFVIRYKKGYSSAEEGAVAVGVDSPGIAVVPWGIWKPRTTPFAEVSVTSPPMIWFLYTRRVAYTGSVALG